MWDNRAELRGVRFEFVETSKFSERRDAYFGGDEGYRLFQLALLDEPRRGTVIPGAGGTRKTRWRGYR